MKFIKTFLVVSIFLTTALTASVPITDPLQSFYTLNSHGGFSKETFTLPDNVYVLVPHPKGLEVAYTLSSPPGNQTFEEMIYKGQKGLLPQPTSGGWRLYKPGETIRNLFLSPWSGVDDTEKEYQKWVQLVPPTDKKYVQRDGKGKIPKFALVPARDSQNKELLYNGALKLKVKVFGYTDLRSVLQEVAKQSKGAPVILIPLACNYNDKVGNENISITWKKSSSLQALFAN